MTDDTVREANQTTIRAAFKPRPRLGDTQVGMSHDARLVHRVRVLRRWTQERLGAELGVSQDTISNWERGRCHPTILAVVAMQGWLSAAAG